MIPSNFSSALPSQPSCPPATHLASMTTSKPRLRSVFSRACVLTGLGLGLSFALLTGCSSFKLKNPPPGFIEVNSSDWSGDSELRMKAPDNVGLNITTFPNFKGGKLPLWSDDLVKKLGARGYELVRQTAVESANGVAGARFDFRYQPPGTEEQKFYTAVLFVTDEWRVVVQLGGEAGLESAHNSDLEGILRDLKVRGCKVGKKTCEGPQPVRLSTPATAEAKVATGQDDPAPEAQDKPGGEHPKDSSAED